MKMVRLMGLVIFFGLLVTHVIFAKTNNVYRTAATQESVKPGSTRAAKKNSSFINGTGLSGTKKHSSTINGSEINHKH